jgi:hypothetical protein
MEKIALFNKNTRKLNSKVGEIINLDVMYDFL